MRLVDLDPRWLLRDGVRVGFIFTSPTNPKFKQSCMFVPMPRREQWALFVAAGEDVDRSLVQGCRPESQWACSPPPADATFESLSVTPSLDGSAGGLWHGFITNGEIVGGL